MDVVLARLKRGRAAIAERKNWRQGNHPDETVRSDTPPLCAGAALWEAGGGKQSGDIESEAIRCLMRAAGLELPNPLDVDIEINRLVDWNDSHDHPVVLAAFDAAIAALEAADKVT